MQRSAALIDHIKIEQPATWSLLKLASRVYDLREGRLHLRGEEEGKAMAS